ncbi:glycoside hydrolase family 5 protein [Trematosphaeria pertusa]|uniref:glucan 1,3-beta-glucosidase n=1 Tax=Trematosphaeria pertusa TaxID=390896 RepID=A0A6A6HY35_9PLEO|nr:glycoside hydrolase family 5 protein [Trematosphaeria pertusa]KAF2242280.1 glycoside hydrolase family 5 protein [Trematosphaeria pertusa]
MDPDHRERRRRERRESRAEHTDTERRRRKGHRATDSQGDLLPPPRQARRQSDSEWESPSPRKKRDSRATTPGESTPSGSRDSAPLSLDALARLDKANAKRAGWKGRDYDELYLKEVRRKEERREKERLRVEEEKRRAYESDVAAEEEARRRKEERRQEERRKAREQRKSAYTDDEREKRRSAYAAEERDKRGSYTDAEREERRRRYEEKYTPSERAERKERKRQGKQHRTEQKKRRLVSGPLAEEGGVDDDDEYQYMMEKRGGAGSETRVYTEEELARRKKIKCIVIGVVSVLIILAIIIPVAVMMSKKNNDHPGESVAAAGAQKPANSNLDGKDPNSVPADKKGTIYDPWAWWDTTDFNVTYTGATVGGLPIIGLNSTWDDDVQANEKVPNLKDTFEYGKMPIRGINVGGWLNIEPFITPSFFESYGTRDNIVDEWTLCTKLGAQKSKETLEKHYSAFVTKQTFVDIRNAGFDHVRIPFGYWMVETYDGDPYVSQVSWRYLLRGIEYARQNGLRVNLDYHGAPGSQNGWNHSGRQGVIGWLNGTDGDLNAQRWLDIHHKLSVFFAQPRYKNIVTMYGIVNEPRMVDMNTNIVLNWTQKAIDQIRKDNITAVLVFGDGFLGLDNWQGKLQGNDNLLLDVHQYVIFNVNQLSLKHTDKLNFACAAWTQQSKRSMDTTTGFGPTMCGEWSQADTDCTQYINNVNTGTRWEGTYDTGNASTSILTPQCPPKDSTCSCSNANADPASYSDAYKKWLYQFSVAQMISFEAGWGWFYWTWETEKATQWSWKLGMKAGILPSKVWERDFDCPSSVSDLEDFGELGLSETY